VVRFSTVGTDSVPDPSPGKYREAYSKSRTGDAITSLTKLKPAEALVVGLAEKISLIACESRTREDIEQCRKDIEAEEQSTKPGSRIQKIPVDFLEIGDVVRVPTGSTPPMDGVVISGHSLFDESSVTGESKPIKKNSGDHVFLGTVNIGQAIDVRIDVAEGKTMSASSFLPQSDIHRNVGLIMSSMWSGTVRQDEHLSSAWGTS